MRVGLCLLGGYYAYFHIVVLAVSESGDSSLCPHSDPAHPWPRAVLVSLRLPRLCYLVSFPFFLFSLLCVYPSVFLLLTPRGSVFSKGASHLVITEG